LPLFRHKKFRNLIPELRPSYDSASGRRLDNRYKLRLKFAFNFKYKMFATFLNRAACYIFAERLSSATNVLGAERAARSTIRDKHVRSL
jgi:hypothetical protein